MNYDLTKNTLPEELELEKKKSELNALSDVLAGKELKLAEVKLSMNRFQQYYFKEVGSKYVELDEIRAKIAELKAQKNRNDKQAQEAAKEARKTANATADDFKTYKESGDFEEKTQKVSEEARKLYRKIASIIHPDKSTDNKSRKIRTKLMAELNAAYEKDDMDSMRKILNDFQASPETVDGEGTAADLIRIIRTINQVNRRIAEIEKELEQIRKSDIIQLMLQVNKGSKKDRNILREMAEEVQQDIKKARRELEGLNK